MSNNRLVTRRRALWLGLASMTSIGAVTTARNGYHFYQTRPFDNPKRDFTVRGQASLMERAAARGLIYGAAASQHHLVADTKLTASFNQQCGILVPENELKWVALRPAPNKFDFTRGDWLAKFARTHGMLFRGHTLIWNQTLPKWFKEVVNRQNAERFILEHINTVARHYAGQIHSWDVVNEAIAVTLVNVLIV